MSGKTKICGVIGDPIEHTMSPAIHNAAFNKLGLDYVYLPFQVKKEELGRAIEGMRGLNIKGLSVTIPHKVAVIILLDELDHNAERIGAINTITNDNGVLKGYNTDAGGFRQALLEKGVTPEGKNIVILGAGGVSRTISFTLAEEGARLVILNRLLELDWAKELASRLSLIFNREFPALELVEGNLAKAIERADILVNATSVGMSPNVNETLVPARLLKPGLVVFDVVYNPIKTMLLKEAEAAGAEIISGVDMLVWQGALAFKMWTGVEAPLELMREELIKRLQNNEK
ncbi:MAG: shikimate dehydrogenase [Dehalococcoidia bacterium]|nr:MAG: shikimate dehydrogenase [Dehalococcoidia bacterium]